MASFLLYSHQELPKSDPALAALWCKGALICLHTPLKGAKTFYICSLWMCEAIKGSLQPQGHNHDIIASFNLTVTKNCQNLTQLRQINSVRVHLYAYLPQWKMLKLFYICPLWMCEAIKGGLEPKSWHHGIISTWHHPELPKSDAASAGSWCKGALVCYVPHWKVK
jgi:hypothetical protein